MTTSLTTPPASSLPQRCGFIAVIGAPNAGKSTLVNSLVGAKVTIVSHKVQTTRIPVRGIALHGQSQLIFIDTPGIFKPRRRLDRAMVDAAWGGAGDGDLIALIIDAQKGLDEGASAIVQGLKARHGRPVILILNKVDRLSDKSALLALAKAVEAELKVAAVFMVSALTGDGLDALTAYLAGEGPEGPWHYPEDEISDIPMRLLVAEITREGVYRWLHDELPYAITVETTSWKTLRNKSIRIEQTIFVERESQRKIVLGHKGETIKRISSGARATVAEITGQTVHLFLFVKIREKWGEDPERYREMGLQFPRD